MYAGLAWFFFQTMCLGSTLSNCHDVSLVHAVCTNCFPLKHILGAYQIRSSFICCYYSIMCASFYLCSKISVAVLFVDPSVSR
jgi:hypothetical protein